MRREDLLALGGTPLGDGRGPLDPVTELTEVLVEEHEHRDRLVFALIEPALHEVQVLIAVEDPHVQRRHLFVEPAEDRQIGHDIATPVLSEDEDAKLLWQRLEGAHRLRVEHDPAFVLRKALLVARHRRLELVVRDALVPARTVNCHVIPPRSDCIHVHTTRITYDIFPTRSADTLRDMPTTTDPSVTLRRGGLTFRPA